jgi:opacity protein-like surface antigen
VFGLALVASLALAGLAASSASALSLSRNIEATGGGGQFTFAAAGQQTNSCSSSELHLRATSSTSGVIDNLKLKGCKMLIFGFSANCTSPGQVAGTIALSNMNFSLVYLDAAKTKFGMKLDPVSGPVAEFTCGGSYSYKWTGSILGQIVKPPLNVFTTSTTLKFAATGSSQNYQQIEGAGLNYHLYQTPKEGTAVDLGITAEDTLNSASGYEYLP